MQQLRAEGIPPPSNLLMLSRIGLLKLNGTTSSGNRKYYTIPDSKDLEKALKLLSK